MDSSARLYKATRWFISWRCGFKAETGRKASQDDLRFESEFLVLTHDLAQEFGTEAVHRRLAILSVHQAGELFQLLQHVKRDSIPFLTELPERFIKLDFLLQLFQGPHLPLTLQGTGAVFSTEYIHHQKSSTVVFSKGYCVFI